MRSCIMGKVSLASFLSLILLVFKFIISIINQLNRERLGKGAHNLHSQVFFKIITFDLIAARLFFGCVWIKDLVKK